MLELRLETISLLIPWRVEVHASCMYGVIYHSGEFDPGSERTLAAWIRHASRTRKGSNTRVKWRTGE